MLVGLLCDLLNAMQYLSAVKIGHTSFLIGSTVGVSSLLILIKSREAPQPSNDEHSRVIPYEAYLAAGNLAARIVPISTIPWR